MSEAKHMPGPWQVEGQFDAEIGVEIVSDGSVVCELEPYMEDWQPHEIANARLIAAAPELLEALKGVMALIESGQLRRNTSDDANPDWAMRQVPFVMALSAAKKAIESAEGRS